MTKAKESQCPQVKAFATNRVIAIELRIMKALKKGFIVWEKLSRDLKSILKMILGVTLTQSLPEITI